MRYLTCFVLTLAVATTALAADSPDLKVYRSCTEAGRAAGATPSSVLAACKSSAEAGIPAAQYLIGVMFLNADGPSSREANQWLSRAAATGHPPAEHALGLLRLQSDNPSEKEEGRGLIRRAACSGYPAAVQLLDKIKITRDQLQCADAEADFSGTWQLALTVTKAAPTGTPKLNFRITVDNGAAKVFYDQDGKWIEAKAGKFRLVREGQTAMVSSIDSGWDFEGQWIETWTFHLLRTGARSAFVNFVRTVNNPHLPVTLSWKTFSVVAEGNATLE